MKRTFIKMGNSICLKSVIVDQIISVNFDVTK